MRYNEKYMEKLIDDDNISDFDSNEDLDKLIALAEEPIPSPVIPLHFIQL